MVLSSGLMTATEMLRPNVPSTGTDLMNARLQKKGTWKAKQSGGTGGFECQELLPGVDARVGAPSAGPPSAD